MTNLDELTKQKFERMGWGFEADEWWKDPSPDEYADYCRLTPKQAQLITLDSEIEKLEAWVEGYDFGGTDVHSRHIEDAERKNLGNIKRLTELKKMREELLI